MKILAGLAAFAALAAPSAGAKSMTEPAKMEAAVHAYVAAFEAGSADDVAELYAMDATVEDPIGSPVHKGREAIRAFYAQSMKTGAKLTLDGPVRVVGDYAVFPFSVHLEFGGKKMRIDVIDTFKFDGDGKVAEMRAFWGPTNMIAN
jgi:steroid Delta-isomerase